AVLAGRLGLVLGLIALVLCIARLAVGVGDGVVVRVEVGGVAVCFVLVGLVELVVVALGLLLVLLLELLHRVGRIVLPLGLGVRVDHRDRADHLASVRGAHLEAIELYRLLVADLLILLFLGHRNAPLELSLNLDVLVLLGPGLVVRVFFVLLGSRALAAALIDRRRIVRIARARSLRLGGLGVDDRHLFPGRAV